MAETKMDVQRKESDSMEKIERSRRRNVYYPPVDIIERTDDILVYADMPGVNKETITVTLEKNELTIRGEVKLPEFSGFDEEYLEYEIGDYERSFALSDVIDQTKIEASYKNGVLKLRLPKAEPAKPKRIEIQAE